MNSSKIFINIAVALFALLLLVGLVGLYLCEIRPWQIRSGSNKWLPIECQLIAVHTKDIDSSRQYFGTYTYTYNNKRYQSDQLTSLPGGTKLRISVGETYQGRVNPANPTDAILFPNERLPALATWILYGWVMLSAIGFIQYVRVRLNKKPMPMDFHDRTPKYYSDM